MKRITFVLCLLLTSFGFSQAQLLKFGVRAGVSSSSISASDIRIQDLGGSLTEIRAKAGDATVGFHFGGLAQINVPVLPLMIIPEILYTSTGGQVQVETISSGNALVTEVKNQKFGRMDIPVMVALKAGPARLQAGPVASFILSEQNGLFDAVKQSVGTVQTAVQEKASGATFGFQAGIGVNIAEKIALDLKYEGNLSKMGDGVKVGGTSYNLDSRPSQLMLSVGYLF